MVYYPVPIHRQAYLQEFVPGADALSLPVTDQLAGEVLSLPVRPDLTDAELDAIVEAVRAVATPARAAVA
jgi:dTDP-4-amino-4,6-dideoxygalactose transaminase